MGRRSSILEAMRTIATVVLVSGLRAVSRRRRHARPGTVAAQLSQAFGGAQAELVATEAKILGEVLAMLNDEHKKKVDPLYAMIPQLTTPARAGR